jgi:hypothetical protein
MLALSYAYGLITRLGTDVSVWGEVEIMMFAKVIANQTHATKIIVETYFSHTSMTFPFHIGRWAKLSHDLSLQSVVIHIYQMRANSVALMRGLHCLFHK